jgi:penicillin-binding protein 1A
MGLIRKDTNQVIEQHPELFADAKGNRRKGRATPPGNTTKKPSTPVSRKPASLKTKKSPKKTPPKVKALSPWKARALKFVSWTGILVLAAPLAGGGACLGGLFAWLNNCPSLPEIDSYDPPEATIILDCNGQQLASLFEQKRHVISMDELPPELSFSFVAIEDHRYYQHFGVDFLGLARAMAINLSRGKLTQGASTITQQTARNVLTRVGREKTANRKVREMLVALQMEHLYTKDQILEIYMNQIYLGSGTYGVEAAAQTYFDKSASDLNLMECATLGGLPQLPERYSPLNNIDLSKHRRNQVLGRMMELGFISPDKFQDCVLDPVEIAPREKITARAPYCIDAVRQEISQLPALEGEQLQSAGWRILTTVDPATQEMARQCLLQGLAQQEQRWLDQRQIRYEGAISSADYAALPRAGQIRMAKVKRVYKDTIAVELPGEWRADLKIPLGSAEYFHSGKTLREGDGVDIIITQAPIDRGGLFFGELLPATRLQGALVCLDTQTGDVRALVGGRDYNDKNNNGFFNRALHAHRQAGSTLKPFFYAAALERGLTPWTVIYDEPISFSDGYTPHNYENRSFGATTLQTALEHSRNIPTIKLVQEVGLRNSLEYVKNFQRFGRDQWTLPMEWPVVLGTSGVTPLELAGAYQVLSNGGVGVGPRLIKNAWNEEQREAMGLPHPDTEQIMTDQASAYIVQMMMGVMNQGTGKKLRSTLPESLRDRIAGKSGTTNDNRDAWFAGFSPHDVVVVWVGFDQNLPMGKSHSGSKTAGPIWADFMSKIWGGKTPEQQQQSLNLPEGYRLVAVNPRTSDVILPNSPLWMDPPTWRVMTNQDYQEFLLAQRVAETKNHEPKENAQLLIHQESDFRSLTYARDPDPTPGTNSPDQ